MNRPRDHHAELAPLVAAAIEQTISDTGWTKLTDLLRRDPAARRAYLRLMCIHGQMVSRYSHRESKAIEIPAEAVAAKPRAAAQRGPGVSPTVPRSALRVPTWSLAAALIIACGIGIYIFVSSLPHSELPDPTSPPSILCAVGTTIRDPIAEPS